MAMTVAAIETICYKGKETALYELFSKTSITVSLSDERFQSSRPD